MSYEVRECRLGKGVYAARPLQKGETVISGWGPVGPERTRHSIQVGHDSHVTIRTDLELINHSCEPNCGLLIRHDVPCVEIQTLRPVEPGEELTMDYASFEDDIRFMTDPCLCGSPACRGRIVGYHGLPADRRAALGVYVAQHLRELDAPVYAAG